MPSFLAGQRVPAAALNSLASLTADIAGGPTSGTTELLLSGSLVIPAATIERVITPSLTLALNPDNAGEVWDVRIRETDVSGTIRGDGRFDLTDAGITRWTVLGTPFTLDAGTPLTLVATIQRFAGTGNVAVSGTTPRGLIAHFSPAT